MVVKPPVGTAGRLCSVVAGPAVVAWLAVVVGRVRGIAQGTSSVGPNQLQYRFFRTSKPKSHHKTNTFCPITPFCPITRKRKTQCDTRLKYRFVPVNQKSPKRTLRGLLVAPTGVDPVTFRFSVERSTN